MLDARIVTAKLMAVADLVVVENNQSIQIGTCKPEKGGCEEIEEIRGFVIEVTA